MASTDLTEQRTKECRRLAAVARNASDKAFWLGLVERWQAVENRSGRLHCLRRGHARGPLAKHSPGRGGRAPGANSRPYKT
jgi:hypothetical protein